MSGPSKEKDMGWFGMFLASCSPKRRRRKRNKVYPLLLGDKPTERLKPRLSRYELAALQREQEAAEEACMEREEDLWRLHHVHRRQLTEQRRLLEAMIREFEMSRNQAQQELQESRRKLEEERHANKRQMEQEMGKLRELERALLNQRSQQEAGCQTGFDRSDSVSRASVGSDTSGSLAGFAEVYGAELSRLQAVVEEQRRKLSAMEETQRRSEDGLLRKQSVMEEMFLASSDRLEVQKQQLQELEHKYQNEDLSSLDSVSSQSSWLEQLEARQAKLRAYIDEKEQDFQSDAERVDPIGESGSDESLTSSKGYKRHVKAALMQQQQQHKRTGSDSGHYSYLLHQSSQFADIPVPTKHGKSGRRGTSPSQSPSPVSSNRKASPKLKPSLLAEQVTARLYRPPPAKRLTDIQGGARSKQPPNRPPDLQLGVSSSESSAPSTPRSALLKSLPGGSLISGSPSLHLSSSSLASVPESMDESLPDSEQMDISESWPIQRRPRSSGRLKARPASLPDTKSIPTIKVEHVTTKIVPFIPPKLGPNRPKGAILSLMQPLPLKKQRVQRSDSDPCGATSRGATDDDVFKGPADLTPSVNPQQEGAVADKSIPSPTVPSTTAVAAAASAAVEAGSSTRSKSTFQRDAPTSPSTLHRPTRASMAKQAPSQPYMSPARRSPGTSRSSSTHSQDGKQGLEQKHSLERRHSQGDNTHVRGRGTNRRSSASNKTERKRPGSAPPRPGSAPAHSHSPQLSPRPQRASSKESVTSERSRSRGSSLSERSTSRDSSFALDSPGPIRRQVASKARDSPGSVRKDKSASAKTEDSSKTKATKRPVKPGSPLSMPKKRSKDSDIPVEIYVSSRQPDSAGSTDDRESPHRSAEHSHQIFVSSLRGGSEVDTSQPFSEEVFQTDDGTKVIMRTRCSSENQQEGGHSHGEVDAAQPAGEAGDDDYEQRVEGTLEALAGADHSSDEAQRAGDMDYSSDSLDENAQNQRPGVPGAVQSEAPDLVAEQPTGKDNVRDSVATGERMSRDSLDTVVVMSSVTMVQSANGSTWTDNMPNVPSALSSHMDSAVLDSDKSQSRSQNSPHKEDSLSFHLIPPHEAAENRSHLQVTCQTSGEVQGQVKSKADTKTSTGSPSSSRRSVRQRSLRRSPLVTADTESDQGGTMSDDSLSTESRSRLGSRPSSAAKRRRRQPRPASDSSSKRAKTHSSEEYQSTDNDSNFSEDSLGGDEEFAIDENTLADDIPPEQLSEMTNTVRAITSQLSSDVLSTITESVQALTSELLNDQKLDESPGDTVQTPMEDKRYDCENRSRNDPAGRDQTDSSWLSRSTSETTDTAMDQDVYCRTPVSSNQGSASCQSGHRSGRDVLHLEATPPDVWSSDLDTIFSETEALCSNYTLAVSDGSSNDVASSSIAQSQASLGNLSQIGSSVYESDVTEDRHDSNHTDSGSTSQHHTELSDGISDTALNIAESQSSLGNLSLMASSISESEITDGRSATPASKESDLSPVVQRKDNEPLGPYLRRNLFKTAVDLWQSSDSLSASTDDRSDSHGRSQVPEEDLIFSESDHAWDSHSQSSSSDLHLSGSYSSSRIFETQTRTTLVEEVPEEGDIPFIDDEPSKRGRLLTSRKPPPHSAHAKPAVGLDRSRPGLQNIPDHERFKHLMIAASGELSQSEEFSDQTEDGCSHEGRLSWSMQSVSLSTETHRKDYQVHVTTAPPIPVEHEHVPTSSLEVLAAEAKEIEFMDESKAGAILVRPHRQLPHREEILMHEEARVHEEASMSYPKVTEHADEVNIQQLNDEEYSSDETVQCDEKMLEKPVSRFDRSPEHDVREQQHMKNQAESAQDQAFNDAIEKTKETAASGVSHGGENVLEEMCQTVVTIKYSSDEDLHEEDSNSCNTSPNLSLTEASDTASYIVESSSGVVCETSPSSMDYLLPGGQTSNRVSSPAWDNSSESTISADTVIHVTPRGSISAGCDHSEPSRDVLEGIQEAAMPVDQVGSEDVEQGHIAYDSSTHVVKMLETCSTEEKSTIVLESSSGGEILIEPKLHDPHHKQEPAMGPKDEDSVAVIQTKADCDTTDSAQTSLAVAEGIISNLEKTLEKSAHVCLDTDIQPGGKWSVEGGDLFVHGGAARSAQVHHVQVEVEMPELTSLQEKIEVEEILEPAGNKDTDDGKDYREGRNRDSGYYSVTRDPSGTYLQGSMGAAVSGSSGDSDESDPDDSLSTATTTTTTGNTVVSKHETSRTDSIDSTLTDVFEGDSEDDELAVMKDSSYAACSPGEVIPEEVFLEDSVESEPMEVHASDDCHTDTTGDELEISPRRERSGSSEHLDSGIFDGKDRSESQLADSGDMAYTSSGESIHDDLEEDLGNTTLVETCPVTEQKIALVVSQDTEMECYMSGSAGDIGTLSGMLECPITTGGPDQVSRPLTHDQSGQKQPLGPTDRHKQCSMEDLVPPDLHSETYNTTSQFEETHVHGDALSEVVGESSSQKPIVNVMEADPDCRHELKTKGSEADMGPDSSLHLVNISEAPGDQAVNSGISSSNSFLLTSNPPSSHVGNDPDALLHSSQPILANAAQGSAVEGSVDSEQSQITSIDQPTVNPTARLSDLDPDQSTIVTGRQELTVGSCKPEEFHAGHGVTGDGLGTTSNEIASPGPVGLATLPNAQNIIDLDYSQKRASATPLGVHSSEDNYLDRECAPHQTTAVSDDQPDGTSLGECVESRPCDRDSDSEGIVTTSSEEQHHEQHISSGDIEVTRRSNPESTELQCHFGDDVPSLTVDAENAGATSDEYGNRKPQGHPSPSLLDGTPPEGVTAPDSNASKSSASSASPAVPDPTVGDQSPRKSEDAAHMESDVSLDEGYATLVVGDISYDLPSANQGELDDNGAMLLDDLSPEHGAQPCSEGKDVIADADAEPKPPGMSEHPSGSPRFQSSPMPPPVEGTVHPETHPGPQDLHYSDLHLRTISQASPDHNVGDDDAGHFEVVHFKAPSPKERKKRSAASQEQAMQEFELLVPSEMITVHEDELEELNSNIPQGATHTYVVERRDGRSIRLGDWDDAGTVVEPPYKESYDNPRPLDDKYYMQEVGGFDAFRCLIESGEMGHSDDDMGDVKDDDNELSVDHEDDDNVEKTDSSDEESDGPHEISFEYEREYLATIDENSVLGEEPDLTTASDVQAEENASETHGPTSDLHSILSTPARSPLPSYELEYESQATADLDDIQDRLDPWRDVKQNQLSIHRDSITSMSVQVGDQGEMDEVLSDADAANSDVEDMTDMEDFILNPDTSIAPGNLQTIPESNDGEAEGNFDNHLRQDRYGSMIVNIGETESAGAVSDDEPNDSESSETSDAEYEMADDTVDVWSNVHEVLRVKAKLGHHEDSCVSMNVNVGELEFTDALSEDEDATSQGPMFVQSGSDEDLFQEARETAMSPDQKITSDINSDNPDGKRRLKSSSSTLDTFNTADGGSSTADEVPMVSRHETEQRDLSKSKLEEQMKADHQSGDIIIPESTHAVMTKPPGQTQEIRQDNLPQNSDYAPSSSSEQFSNVDCQLTPKETEEYIPVSPLETAVANAESPHSMETNQEGRSLKSSQNEGEVDSIKELLEELDEGSPRVGSFELASDEVLLVEEKEENGIHVKSEIVSPSNSPREQQYADLQELEALADGSDDSIAASVVHQVLSPNADRNEVLSEDSSEKKSSPREVTSANRRRHLENIDFNDTQVMGFDIPSSRSTTHPHYRKPYEDQGQQVIVNTRSTMDYTNEHHGLLETDMQILGLQPRPRPVEQSSDSEDGLVIPEDPMAQCQQHLRHASLNIEIKPWITATVPIPPERPQQVKPPQSSPHHPHGWEAAANIPQTQDVAYVATECVVSPDPFGSASSRKGSNRTSHTSNLDKSGDASTSGSRFNTRTQYEEVDSQSRDIMDHVSSSSATTQHSMRGNHQQNTERFDDSRCREDSISTRINYRETESTVAFNKERTNIPAMNTESLRGLDRELDPPLNQRRNVISEDHDTFEEYQRHLTNQPVANVGRLSPGEVPLSLLTTQQLMSEMVDAENALLSQYDEAAEGSLSAPSSQSNLSSTADTAEMLSDMTAVMRYMAEGEDDGAPDHLNLSRLHDTFSPGSSAPRDEWMPRIYEFGHRSVSVADLDPYIRRDWYEGRSLSLDCLLWAADVNMGNRTMSGDSFTYVFMPRVHSYDAMVTRSMEDVHTSPRTISAPAFNAVNFSQEDFHERTSGSLEMERQHRGEIKPVGSNRLECEDRHMVTDERMKKNVSFADLSSTEQSADVTDTAQHVDQYEQQLDDATRTSHGTEMASKFDGLANEAHPESQKCDAISQTLDDLDPQGLASLSVDMLDAAVSTQDMALAKGGHLRSSSPIPFTSRMQSSGIQTDESSSLSDIHSFSNDAVAATPGISTALVDLSKVLEAQHAIMQATEMQRQAIEQWQQFTSTQENKVIWKHSVTLSTQTGSSIETSDASDDETDPASASMLRSMETQTYASTRIIETQTSDVSRVIETQTETDILDNQQASASVSEVSSHVLDQASDQDQVTVMVPLQVLPKSSDYTSLGFPYRQAMSGQPAPSTHVSSEAGDSLSTTGAVVEYSIAPTEVWSTTDEGCKMEDSESEPSSALALEHTKHAHTQEIAIQAHPSLEDLRELGISEDEVKAYQDSDAELDQDYERLIPSAGIAVEGAPNFDLSPPELGGLQQEHEKLEDFLRRSRDDHEARKKERKELMQNRTTLLMELMNKEAMNNRDTNVSPSDSGLSALSTSASLSTITAVPATPSFTETSSMASDTDFSSTGDKNLSSPRSVGSDEKRLVSPRENSDSLGRLTTSVNGTEEDQRLLSGACSQNSNTISHGLSAERNLSTSSQSILSSEEEVIESHIKPSDVDKQNSMSKFLSGENQGPGTDNRIQSSQQHQRQLKSSSETHESRPLSEILQSDLSASQSSLRSHHGSDDTSVTEEMTETRIGRAENLLNDLEALMHQPESSTRASTTETSVNQASVNDAATIQPSVIDGTSSPSDIDLKRPVHQKDETDSRTNRTSANEAVIAPSIQTADSSSYSVFQPPNSVSPSSPQTNVTEPVDSASEQPCKQRPVVVLQSEEQGHTRILEGSIRGQIEMDRPSSRTAGTQYEDTSDSHNPSQGSNHIHLNVQQNYNLYAAPQASNSSNRASPTMSDTKDESVGTDPSLINEYDDELERLRRERERILAMLAKDMMPSKFQVELAEAQLNYIIGQTDTLLSTLDDHWDWDSAQLMEINNGEEHMTALSKEYLTHYRQTLETSRVQIEKRITDLEKDRERNKRSRERQRQNAILKREAEIRAFHLEREREQTSYEHIRSLPRSRSDSPAIRSQVTHERQRTTSESSNNSSVYVEPEPLSAHALTPKQRKQHLIDLRKGLLSFNNELRTASPTPSESNISNRSFSPVFTYSTYSVYTTVSSPRDEPGRPPQQQQPPQQQDTLAPGYTLYSTAIPPTDAVGPRSPRHVTSPLATMLHHSTPAPSQMDEDEAGSDVGSLDHASQRLLNEYQVARGRAEMEIQRARQTLETRRAKRTSPYQQMQIPSFEVANIREDIQSTRLSERDHHLQKRKVDRQRIDAEIDNEIERLKVKYGLLSKPSPQPDPSPDASGLSLGASGTSLSSSMGLSQRYSTSIGRDSLATMSGSASLESSLSLSHSASMRDTLNRYSHGSVDTRETLYGVTPRGAPYRYSEGMIRSPAASSYRSEMPSYLPSSSSRPSYSSALSPERYSRPISAAAIKARLEKEKAKRRSAKF